MSTAELATSEEGKIDQQAAQEVIDQTLDQRAEDLKDEEGHTDDSQAAETTAGTKGTEDTQVPVPSDEKPAGDDEEAAVAPEDQPGDEEQDWTTSEDLAEIVQSMGLSEEDLAEFGGRKAFNHHVSLMDRQFMVAGKEALAGEETPPQETEAQRRAADQPRDRGKFARTAEQSDEGYKPKLESDEHGEDLTGEFKRLDQHHTDRMDHFEARVEARFAEMGQREMDAQHQREADAFEDIVDGLGHEDIFGKSSTLRKGSEEWKARQQLWDGTGDLRLGQDAKGHPAPMSRANVRRALNLKFADKLITKNRQQLTAKIQKQSARKLGGGAQKANLDRPFTGDVRDDPALLEGFKRIAAETGE